MSAVATNAYDLLTKPTLELTDAEVALVVEDLQKRRRLYVDKGTKDAPKPAVDKAAATADLLSDLGL